MTYRIEIKRSAEKQLAQLNAPERVRVVRAIDALATDPRPTNCKKLVGANVWRIRIGTYRVVYEVRDDVLLVLVVAVAHRREVYR